MNATESLEDFYRHKFNWLPDNLQKDIGHFNVFRLEDCMGPGKEPVAYSRRDFYKILLVRGHHVCHYSDKSLEVSGTALLFFSPDIPYTFEPLSDNLTGCFCIFKESFFTEHLRQNIRTLPMFAPGNKPAYILDEQQDRHIDELFGKMMAELNSDYIYKYDLIRNYVTEMIHDALKMQPTDALYHQMDANTRITMIFTELLERQFPIESNNQRFALRSASDFAERLSVHVNHLNRAIKETTGKTTTSHIAERLAAEACILLRHTNWNISEIGYCLGFDDPAHFNHFFRKQTQQTPSAYRK